MKELLFLLLSVVLIGSVGCGSNKDPGSEIADSSSVEAVLSTDVTTTEMVSVETEDPKMIVPESTEVVKETDFSDDKSSPDKDNQSNKASEDKSVENKKSDEKVHSDNQKPAEQSKDMKSEPISEQHKKQECNSMLKQKTEPEPELPVLSYSPDRVVNLAISKCQSGGMVTTEQHLKDNLNTGKITKEEYDEYYPLDGLEDSYYSVFVNVDLNKAATTSGKALGSDEEIAQYIADMLLLETDFIFNIRYTGTTTTSGETFYEFRCYR